MVNNSPEHKAVKGIFTILFVSELNGRCNPKTSFIKINYSLTRI